MALARSSRKFSRASEIERPARRMRVMAKLRSDARGRAPARTRHRSSAKATFLDAPMVPGEAQQALRRGRLRRQAGDEVDDLGALRAISRLRSMRATWARPGQAR